jgi:hypothetical protein
MPTIKIHNVETDEIIEREMNEAELKQWTKDQDEALEIAQLKKESLLKRQALLNKLGITEDEARLLLG